MNNSRYSSGASKIYKLSLPSISWRMFLECSGGGGADNKGGGILGTGGAQEF